MDSEPKTIWVITEEKASHLTKKEYLKMFGGRTVSEVIDRIKELRDDLLEVCDTNTKVDWNTSEAQDEFNDMYSLISLKFDSLLKEMSDE